MRLAFIRPRKIRVIVPIILAIALSVGTPPVHSTEKPSQKASHKTVSSQAAPCVSESGIQDINERIEVSEAAENEATTQQLGVSVFNLQARTAKLREIKAVCQRLLTATKQQNTLSEEESLLRNKWNTQQQVGLSEKPPYSISFYDHLLDETTTAQQEKKAAELGARLAKRALEEAELELQQAERALRTSREELELGEAGKDLRKLRWDVEQGKLEVDLAREVLSFRKVVLKNLETQIRLAELRTDIGQESIRWVRSHLHFDQDDLENQINSLERQRAQLEKRLTRLEREQIQVEAAWLRVQEEAVSAGNEGKLTAASASLKTREAWRKTYQRVLEQTNHMLHLLSQEEQVWKRRYELVKADVSHEQLDVWQKDGEAQIEGLDRVLALQQNYQTNLQSQIAALVKQASEESISREIREHLQERIQALRKLAERTLEYLSVLLASKELNHRLLDEIASRSKQIALWEKVLAVGSRAKDAWNFELWAFGERAVTLKKLVLALSVFIFGLLIVKYVMRIIRTRLLPRTRLEASAAAALEKILYYFAFLLVILFGLHIVNIPLTAFTFLGGAIAIGVGFGAQNLINNFISGFIIMAERPISIGDLVDVENNLAVVEEIGARCTRIRTAGNVHILVPNSSFLEKSITNWTLSDQLIRTNVTVGVVYGSPVREVKRLLIQAVAKHQKVLKEPEPFVLFNEFGDSSLVFDIYFWISVNRLMERRIIESDIRFRIDNLFREAGIVIAFPQRDVHLDTTRPLEFKLLNTSSPSKEDKE